MQENNSIIIAMLEELLTISKSQQAGQTVNTNVDLTPIKELIENGNSIFRRISRIIPIGRDGLPGKMDTENPVFGGWIARAI